MKKQLFLSFFTLILYSSLTNYSIAQNIYHFAGGGISGYSGDGGPAANCQFKEMINLAIDANGNVYVSDSWNHRVRKIDASGIITTIAGTGVTGFSGDGGLAVNAKLYSPNWVTVDAAGNIYIADASNMRIRKINTSGIISTIAGDGTNGSAGDGGPATSASLNGNLGMTFDAAGNMYFADQNNHKIRKINTSGIITTIAGTGIAGYSGDGGPATNAQLNYPASVRFDANGNLFVADPNNKVIRKINSSGIITTVVGTGTPGYSGDGGSATSAQIGGTNDMVFDSQGNMLFCDQWNHRIRKVTPSGIISTIIGNGIALSSGNGGPAALAEVYQPRHIEIDPNGNLFLIDNGSNSIREVCVTNCLAGIDNALQQNKNQLSIYPNPNNGSFKVEIESESAELNLINTLGQIIYKQSLKNGINEVNVKEIAKGFYSCVINSKEKNYKYGKIFID